MRSLINIINQSIFKKVPASATTRASATEIVSCTRFPMTATKRSWSQIHGQGCRGKCEKGIGRSG